MIKFNPLEWGTIKGYKETMRKLRDFAKDKILRRIKDIENSEHVPDDILTTIINSCSITNFIYSSKYIFVNKKVTFLRGGQS